MTDQVFQSAYARVRSRHDDHTWFSLSPREITDAIYKEIRLMDRERLARTKAEPTRIAVAAE